MSETRLFRIPLDTAQQPERGKVSEMLLEFAEPLLYLDPQGPADIQAFASCLQLAELCWNLPILERNGSRSSPRLRTQLRTQFEQILAVVPKPIADVLKNLIETRKVRFGHIPILIRSRVEGDHLNDARVVAEAREADFPHGR